jgi:hypothetical protein
MKIYCEKIECGQASEILDLCGKLHEKLKGLPEKSTTF